MAAVVVAVAATSFDPHLASGGTTAGAAAPFLRSPAARRVLLSLWRAGPVPSLPPPTWKPLEGGGAADIVIE
uniref:Uncharacterized protein n=1 Tax=Oryza punctata TaxID=4537 RepID=A0A0E0L7C2_ORYPU